MKTRQYKPLRPGQTSYWQNYRKFIVSFQKAIYGDAARADNDWAYDWLPKLDIRRLRHPARLRDDARTARSTATSARASTRCRRFPTGARSAARWAS